ncbi:probable basic-leucine zipper transcription factor Q [Ptychodera flava]|uniref:probable basic-leucine zipper transcription factor Q n=1 Tax=Ptychodera flava TaxID=63121 RepID=UPI00396AAA5B
MRYAEGGTPEERRTRSTRRQRMTPRSPPPTPQPPPPPKQQLQEQQQQHYQEQEQQQQQQQQQQHMLVKKASDHGEHISPVNKLYYMLGQRLSAGDIDAMKTLLMGMQLRKQDTDEPMNSGKRSKFPVGWSMFAENRRLSEVTRNLGRNEAVAAVLKSHLERTLREQEMRYAEGGTPEERRTRSTRRQRMTPRSPPPTPQPPPPPKQQLQEQQQQHYQEQEQQQQQQQQQQHIAGQESSHGDGNGVMGGHIPIPSNMGYEGNRRPLHTLIRECNERYLNIMDRLPHTLDLVDQMLQHLDERQIKFDFNI